MRTEFIVAGVVLGLVVAASRERIRRSRLRAEARVAHGEAATAGIEAIWAHGRNDRRRQIELRFLDARGRAHDAVVELSAAEAVALGARVGGKLEVRYVVTDPSNVVVVRPPILDDRMSTSIVSGAAVFTLCLAVGALVR